MAILTSWSEVYQKYSFFSSFLTNSEVSYLKHSILAVTISFSCLPNWRSTQIHTTDLEVQEDILFRTSQKSIQAGSKGRPLNDAVWVSARVTLIITLPACGYYRNQKVHYHLWARNWQAQGSGDQDLLHYAEDPVHPSARVSHVLIKF